MHCVTPRINVDPNIVQNVGRRKRDASSLVGIPSVVKRSINSPANKLLDRLRRATSDPKKANYQLNKTNELDFYLGFELDGFKDYETLTNKLPDIDKVTVYSDPVLHPFEEDNQIKIFRPYWPFDARHIQIKVSIVHSSIDDVLPSFAVSSVLLFTLYNMFPPFYISSMHPLQAATSSYPGEGRSFLEKNNLFSEKI